MLCNEWSNLLKRYHYAVHAYSEAVDRLDAEFGSGFTAAWQQAESARRKCSDCRNALLAHQRYHACTDQPASVRYLTAAAAAGAGGGFGGSLPGSTEDMVLGDQGQAGG